MGEDRKDEYEKICLMCRRPESRAGKMLEMGNDVCICQECLQRTIDSMKFSGISYNDFMNFMPDFSKLVGGTPGNNGGSTAGNSGGGAPGNNGGGAAGNSGGSTAGSGSGAPGNNGGSAAGNSGGNAAGNNGGSTTGNNGVNTAGNSGGGAPGNNGGGAAGNNGGSNGGNAPEVVGNSQNPDDPEKKDGRENQGNRFGGIPTIGMINLSDILGGMGMGVPRQQIKKKKEKDKKPAKQIDIRNIPAPHRIKASLDEYVVGQEHAKKVISVAVYNHYKRIASGTDDIEIEKSNMLMLGPTGCGKTYLVKTMARLLDVPLAMADATSLTEAGYIGDDIESVISRLLTAADNDVERAEQGIVFIDEIDKIAKKRNANQRDVSGEAVQQGMLKLLEGSEVEVPVGAASKNAMVPMVTVNTQNILFICGGAFPGLEDIIKERLNKQSSVGFLADLKDKYDDDPNLLSKVTVEDLREFGMIPEFIGRLPILFSLEALTKEMLVRILKEPRNAILKQYQKLLALDEVQLDIDEGALEAIAEKALEKKTGARALRSILEEFMLDIMYEIPKDDNIGKVTLTREYIEHTGGPVITLRDAGYRLPAGAG